MVQRRAARFVKGRYGMFESVTQMLEQLTWTPLSKRRENSRLILFYKIINNLAVVPHSCLEKADVRTRKKHSQKFHHIGYNIDLDPRQCGNSLALCYFAVAMELPDSLLMNCKSQFGVIFLRCSPR